MSAAAPICTHIKSDGARCGSPAVKGTSLCHHHSAVKTALGKGSAVERSAYGGPAPIPFLFPEDRASVQINYFLLLQAINEGRIEKRVADLMLRILKSMDKNLGKVGSLVDERAEEAVREENVGEETASEEAVSEQTVSETRGGETIHVQAMGAQPCGEKSDRSLHAFLQRSRRNKGRRR